MPVRDKTNKVITILAYVYITGLFVLLFFSGDRLANADYRRYYNLRPLVKIVHYNWANQKFKWLYYLEIISNIIVFIPFVAAVCTVVKKINSGVVYTIIVIVPVLVETMQYIFAIGVFDVDDIILNITGGLLGALLYYNIIKPRYFM